MISHQLELSRRDPELPAPIEGVAVSPEAGHPVTLETLSPRPSRGKTVMATRTIKIPNGVELTLSSKELEPGDLALAEVLLELAAEQGSARVTVSEDELARRLVAKGYDPHTGNLLH
jgi:hypothetical protein